MRNINWESIQKSADPILADGLWELSKRPFEDYTKVTHRSLGNYLISNQSNPYYIGEAKDVGKRLMQQFNPTTSTFFKNYQKNLLETKSSDALEIDSFKVQYLPTVLGRKEVEEFGIVNLPTNLNKFQLGKRSKYQISSHNGLWKNVQEAQSDLLIEGENEILKSQYTNWFESSVPVKPGLYVVKNEKQRVIYIGETSDMRERFTTHSTTTYFSALRRHIATEVLAFELKERSGKRKYLNEAEDQAVTGFLKTCTVSFCPINFARYELEEYLIKKHKPLLNRKDNKPLNQ